MTVQMVRPCFYLTFRCLTFTDSWTDIDKFVPVLATVNIRQTLDCAERIEMLRPKPFLIASQRSFVQHFGFIVPALISVDVRQTLDCAERLETLKSSTTEVSIPQGRLWNNL